MSRDDDDLLDFDSFEDEHEAHRPDARRLHLGWPGNRRESPASRLSKRAAALSRLIGVIAISIASIVVLMTTTGVLSGEIKQSTYRDHMARLETIGLESNRIGAESAALLTEPGLTRKTLQDGLLTLIRQQESNLSKAEGLDAPGPLSDAAHGSIVALQLRLIGLRGFLSVVRATASEKDSTLAAQQLAAQADRLIASDVLWEDAFVQVAIQVLTERNVVGATPPASIFVKDVADWDVRRLRLLHQRLQGGIASAVAPGPRGAVQATATPGIHGSLLEGVTVDPTGTSLKPETETTVTPSPDLAFRVAVRNSGENPETQVRVTLTISAQPSPIVRTGTIDAIDPGASATVVFDGIPELPVDQRIPVEVRIEPVPGEANTDNNIAEYPVIFSL